jgi:hypothetical protein
MRPGELPESHHILRAWLPPIHAEDLGSAARADFLPLLLVDEYKFDGVEI